MKNSIKNNSGAALLISMIIIATVGVLMLALGRLALSELRITTKLADSTIAYYAAEAGIESGLLIFRYDKNIEITNYESVDINSIDHKINYNQEISYKGNVFVIGKKEYNKITTGIKKDESVSIDVSNLDNIKFQMETKTRPGFLELTFIRESGSLGGTFDVFKIDTIPSVVDSGICPEVSKIGNDINSDDESDFSNKNISVSGYDLLKVKFLNCSNISDIAMIKILPIPVGDELKISTNTTTITSTGEYSLSRRKLEVTIDRQTGTLLGIFDYVLYAGGDPSTGEGNIKLTP